MTDHTQMEVITEELRITDINRVMKDSESK